MPVPCLYRRLSDEAFVRYDPHADRFSVVPSSAVPELTPAAPQRLRMSATGAEKSRGDPYHRAILLTMLEFQRRAHKVGYPEAATPYLKALADLARDPDGQKKLRMSQTGQAPQPHKHGCAMVPLPREAAESLAELGRLVRRLADGRFQIEEKPGKYKATDAAGASAHIQKQWRNQAAEKTKIAEALKRAEVDRAGDNDLFGGNGSEKAGRAAIPEGARAVSLDPNTHGRTGAVKRDESGAAHLVLDGGAEAKATDFEPLNDQHSWRVPGRKSVQPDLFGGEEGAKPEEKPGPSAEASGKMGSPARPQPSIKPNLLADPKALADAVHAAATHLPSLYGDEYQQGRGASFPHKVFVSKLYDHLKASGQLPATATPKDFQAALLAANRGGHLELARNDLPQVVHPDQRGEVARSEIQHPVVPSATFHLVNAPTELPPKAGGQPNPAPAPVAKPDPLKPSMRPLTDEQRAEGFARAEGTSAKALGVTKPAEPARPKPDQEAARVKAALSDPAEWDRLAADAAFPELDRNKLLAAVKEHFGDDLHAQARTRGKGGIIEMLKAAKPKGVS